MESSKKETNSQENYVQVSKDTIADPALSASLNLDLGILRIMQQSVLADRIATIDETGEDGGENDNPDNTNPENTNPETPKPTEPQKKEVESISISTPGALKVGAECTLSVSFTPSDAADKSLSWSSGNTAVATVDSNGK